jgi:hypothetical protein
MHEPDALGVIAALIALGTSCMYMFLCVFVFMHELDAIGMTNMMIAFNTSAS